MNISSLLFSIIFHTCIFLSLIFFFNSELRQKTKIQNDIVLFHILENNTFEKQKESNTLINKQVKTFRTKKDKPIQNFLKKKQSTKMLISQFPDIKEKNFKFKKKNTKGVKSLEPHVKKEFNKNISVIKNKIFNEKPSMSVIPNIEKFRSAKLNQKSYACSKSQRSKHKIKNKKEIIVNKNVTISSLLGNFYNYNPHLINISNLLKTNKRTYQKNLNISELLSSTVDTKINCN